MFEKPLRHPLKWWQFYTACLRYAGSGVLGVIGDAGTVLGVILLLFKAARPVLYALASNYLSSYGLGEDTLIKVPLLIGASILFLRLLAAPFFIYGDKPEAAAEALDVRLEGEFPGAFALHAHGDACEIRISPITIDATIIGTDEGHPLIYPRQTLEFPIVSGLRDGALPIEPTLLSWEGYGRSSSTWPKSGTAEAMKQFLHALWLVRRYRAAQSVLGHDDIDFRNNQFNDAELELFAERMRQPYEIAFDITYWNSDRTLNWKRTEQLVFEPPTNTAFVRHAGRPMPIGRSEAVKRDAS